MCGIFAYLGKTENSLEKRLSLLKPRGPERTKSLQIDNLFLGFQRLCINDTSVLGDQPFVDEKKELFLICNGEIYNSEQLIEKYKLNVHSTSDCEVILPLYKKFGLREAILKLNGVFAFVLYDRKKKVLMAGRDLFGVRPLFHSFSGTSSCFSSEVKPLLNYPTILPFPPNSLWYSTNKNYFAPLYTLPSTVTNPLSSLDKLAREKTTRMMLTLAVQDRFQSDREIGCLLSGGLDSSLITSLVCRLSKKRINTYSIGFKGSPDLIAARKVATFLGTNHHEVIMTEKEAVGVVPELIAVLESWDTTTIRASIGMYLLSKYIAKKTPNVKVLFSGEGADELCQGYLYFHLQKTPTIGDRESRRLLKDMYLYDVLRCDRTTASQGLEVRVPFLDRSFATYYLGLPKEWRSPDKTKGEKWLIRESFKGYLPKEILWRRKDGFSDGCSTLERPLYKVLQEAASKKITDSEMKNAKKLFPHCSPRTKESFWYRKIFRKKFPKLDYLIPYEWLPKWMGDVVNPSGRIVPVFKKKLSPVPSDPPKKLE